jgi:preprotein translocase subunit SecG
MFGLLILLHTIISVLLIAVILLQTGRSGGLTETFGGAAESIFGTKTNTLMIRTTTVLSVLFIISCLSLAYLSREQSKSLMERNPLPAAKVEAGEQAKQASGVGQEVQPAETAKPLVATVGAATSNQIPEATPGKKQE